MSEPSEHDPAEIITPEHVNALGRIVAKKITARMLEAGEYFMGGYELVFDDRPMLDLTQEANQESWQEAAWDEYHRASVHSLTLSIFDASPEMMALILGTEPDAIASED